MGHAQPEKKYMTMMPPRWGSSGCLSASATPTVANLTAYCSGPGGGNAYVFFQADGADLYFMTAPSPGQAGQINPNTQTPDGSIGQQGTPGGSIPTTQGPMGVCGRLLSAIQPLRYILEPGVDMYCGFMLVNPNFTGPAYFRWWRASMLSNG